jgi:hypothetical protein
VTVFPFPVLVSVPPSLRTDVCIYISTDCIGNITCLCVWVWQSRSLGYSLLSSHKICRYDNDISVFVCKMVEAVSECSSFCIV